MPEISDADFNLLKLAQKSLGNGKTRLKTLRMFKEADPEVVLPELDADDRITAANAPLIEENKKLRGDLDKMAGDALLKEKRKICTDRGHKPEDVEKVMLEKGITRHESAIEFIETNSRVAVPSIPSVSFDRSATVPVNDGLKANPAQWAREEAARVWSETHAVKK